MSYWIRQLATQFYLGNVQADEAQRQMWDLQDVPWRTKLIVAGGKTIGAKFLLTNGGNQTLQLPPQYDPTKRLFVLIAASGVLRVSITPVGESPSNALLRGDSVNPGVMCFDDTITSVVVANPTASPIFLEYSMMEIPDLTLPASYREGSIVRGVV